MESESLANRIYEDDEKYNTSKENILSKETKQYSGSNNIVYTISKNIQNLVTIQRNLYLNIITT